MKKKTLRFQLYNKLQKEAPQIYAELKEAAKELKITDAERGQIGLTGAVSGCPSTLRDDVHHAMAEAGRKVVPLNYYVDEIRALVKSVYGDDYDACPVNTCEAALWVTFDCLCTPPLGGRGDNYRGRYIAPYERHVHHQGGYGRPFPPKYKEICTDRGCTSGEMGFIGKRQNNLDTIFVPLVGAKYPCHGIKYHPVPLLRNVDPDASAKVLAETAARHAELLVGFSSLGYDLPGYGYGVKEKNGAPKLQVNLAKLAQHYNVPYIVDNAWGIPFIGTDIRTNGADVMLYSMDKASGSPTAGLIIGKEEPLVLIRRALGMHGNRYGTTASYGKAAYVTNDPGKEALSGMVAALTVLRDKPKVLTRPVDQLYDLARAEFGKIHPKIRNFFTFAKSYNSGAVEINYEKSWEKNEIGIPIFTIEDMYANSNILQTGMSHIGIYPTIAYDANILISGGLGTLDNKGNLIIERMRKAIRAFVLLMEIVCKHAELI